MKTRFPYSFKAISFNKWKLLLAVVLSSVLILPFVIGFLSIEIQRHAIRKAVKHEILLHIDSSELTLVKVHRNEVNEVLEWEHKSEFEYEGEMYDVVRVETTGDSLYYWCLLDSEETELDKKLRQLIVQNLGVDPNEEENKKKLKNYLKKYFGLESSCLSGCEPRIIEKALSLPESSFTSPLLERPGPPPKLG